jgi:hypothetical protein
MHSFAHFAPNKRTINIHKGGEGGRPSAKQRQTICQSNLLFIAVEIRKLRNDFSSELSAVSAQFILKVSLFEKECLQHFLR